jgi:membrane-associated phospholipid phosphatase
MKNYFLPLLITLLSSTSLTYGQNIDIRLLREINLSRNPSLDPYYRGITNSVAPLVVGTPLIMFGVGYLKKDSSFRQNAVCIGATLLAETIVVTILKYGIDRPRPFETYSDIHKATKAVSPSFPSSHTSNAFSMATSLTLAYPKWYIIIPSYSWAVAVAYSRMDLGVHYPSDVLTGAIIGSGSAYLCYLLNKKIRLRSNF